jgi:hypothetical protein
LTSGVPIVGRHSHVLECVRSLQDFVAPSVRTQVLVGSCSTGPVRSDAFARGIALLPQRLGQAGFGEAAGLPAVAPAAAHTPRGSWLRHARCCFDARVLVAALRPLASLRCSGDSPRWRWGACPRQTRGRCLCVRDTCSVASGDDGLPRSTLADHSLSRAQVLFCRRGLPQRSEWLQKWRRKWLPKWLRKCPRKSARGGILGATDFCGKGAQKQAHNFGSILGAIWGQAVPRAGRTPGAPWGRQFGSHFWGHHRTVPGDMDGALGRRLRSTRLALRAAACARSRVSPVASASGSDHGHAGCPAVLIALGVSAGGAAFPVACVCGRETWPSHRCQLPMPGRCLSREARRGTGSPRQAGREAVRRLALAPPARTPGGRWLRTSVLFPFFLVGPASVGWPRSAARRLRRPAVRPAGSQRRRAACGACPPRRQRTAR